MKKLIGIMILMCLMNHPATADQIYVVADPYFPYTGELDAEKPGYLVELIQQIFEKEGHTVKYRTLPWLRALMMIEKGKADCIAGAYADDARNLGIDVPVNETGVWYMYFFAKKGSPAASWAYDGSPRSLSRIRLGVISGYEYGPEFDPYIKSATSRHVEACSGEDALATSIKMLLSGRVDIVMEEYGVFVNTARSLGVWDHIVNVGKEHGGGNKHYVFFSRKISQYSEYTKMFARGMDELRRNGQLVKLLERYGLKDWKDGTK